MILIIHEFNLPWIFEWAGRSHYDPCPIKLSFQSIIPALMMIDLPKNWSIAALEYPKHYIINHGYLFVILGRPDEVLKNRSQNILIGILQRHAYIVNQSIARWIFFVDKILPIFCQEWGNCLWQLWFICFTNLIEESCESIHLVSIFDWLDFFCGSKLPSFRLHIQIII